MDNGVKWIASLLPRGRMLMRYNSINLLGCWLVRNERGTMKAGSAKVAKAEIKVIMA